MIDRITKQDKPINSLDQAALVHDIEYMRPNVNQFAADNKMWTNAIKANIFNLPTANISRLGLLLKDLVGYRPNSSLHDYQLLKQLAVDNGLAKQEQFLS